MSRQQHAPNHFTRLVTGIALLATLVASVQAADEVYLSPCVPTSAQLPNCVPGKFVRYDLSKEDCVGLTNCLKGAYCPNRDCRAIVCPEGQYQNEPGAKNGCKDCPTGKFFVYPDNAEQVFHDSFTVAGGSAARARSPNDCFECSGSCAASEQETVPCTITSDRVCEAKPPVFSITFQGELASEPYMFQIEANKSNVFPVTDFYITAVEYDGSDTLIEITVNPDPADIAVDADAIGTTTNFTLSATNSAGATTSVHVPVTVVDTTPPEVLVNGSIDIEVHSTIEQLKANIASKLVYSDTAFTNDELNVTFIISTVHLDLVGIYAAAVDVADGASNSKQTRATISVRDTTPPTISATGSTVLVFPGTATVGMVRDALRNQVVLSDNYDSTETLTSRLELSEFTIEPEGITTFNVTLTLADTSNNTATSLSLTVVLDLEPPTLSVPDTQLVINYGTSAGVVRAKLLDGVTYSDNVDSVEVLRFLLTLSALNTASLGTQQVTYSLSDSSGNGPVVSMRTVNVTDTEAPTAELAPGASITLEAGVPVEEQLSFILSHLIFHDNYDSPQVVAASATATGDVSVLGFRPLTLTFYDTHSNKGTFTGMVLVMDTTVPFIVLNGNATVEIEAGDAFQDPGASAEDSFDGPVDVAQNATVPTDCLDVRSFDVVVIEYVATDNSGNTNSTTRTVTRKDTTAPSMTDPTPAVGAVVVNGRVDVGFPQTSPEEVAMSFNIPQADDVCMDKVSVILDTSDCNVTRLHIPHECTAVFSASDASGNRNNRTFPLRIVDVTPPVPPTLSDLQLTEGQSYNAELYTSDVTDDVDDSSDVSIATSVTLLSLPTLVREACTLYASGKVPESLATYTPSDAEVDPRAPSGTVYNVTHSFMDRAGNVAEVSHQVTVRDTEAPTLTFHQGTEFDVEFVATTTGGGASQLKLPMPRAYDTHDGNLAQFVCIKDIAVVAKDGSTQSIPLSNFRADVELGTVYTVAYEVQDESGKGASVIATARVVDTVAPLISVSTTNVFSIPFETDFDLQFPTYSAFDAYDGDVTANVTIESTVDSSVVGANTVYLRVSDSSDNVAELQLVVLVSAFDPPSEVHVVAVESTHSALGQDSSAISQLATDLKRELSSFEDIQEKYYVYILRAESGDGTVLLDFYGTDLNARKRRGSADSEKLVFLVALRSKSNNAWIDSDTTIAQLGAAQPPSVERVSSQSTNTVATLSTTTILIIVVCCGVLLLVVVVMVLVRRQPQMAKPSLFEDTFRVVGLNLTFKYPPKSAVKRTRAVSDRSDVIQMGMFAEPTLSPVSVQPEILYASLDGDDEQAARPAGLQGMGGVPPQSQAQERSPTGQSSLVLRNAAYNDVAINPQGPLAPSSRAPPHPATTPAAAPALIIYDEPDVLETVATSEGVVEVRAPSSGKTSPLTHRKTLWSKEGEEYRRKTHEVEGTASAKAPPNPSPRPSPRPSPAPQRKALAVDHTAVILPNPTPLLSVEARTLPGFHSVERAKSESLLGPTAPGTYVLRPADATTAATNTIKLSFRRAAESTSLVEHHLLAWHSNHGVTINTYPLAVQCTTLKAAIEHLCQQTDHTSHVLTTPLSAVMASISASSIHPFHHGDVSRVEAERSLQADARSPLYLFRGAVSNPASQVKISVKMPDGRMAHSLLEIKDDGSYYLDSNRLEPTCASLDDVAALLSKQPTANFPILQQGLASAGVNSTSEL
eukprot:m.311696 g.311696  ORF g.311696 m.311696 type:complete len:1710 (-) comp15959_c0_seq2:376-5505(-)